jgi:hypothetical protein
METSVPPDTLPRTYKIHCQSVHTTGVTSHAADPASVDLADSPDLATAIASLRQQAEDDAVKTQTLPTSRSMD